MHFVAHSFAGFEKGQACDCFQRWVMRCLIQAIFWTGLGVGAEALAQLSNSISGSVVSNGADYSYSGRQYDPGSESSWPGLALDQALTTVRAGEDALHAGAAFINDVTRVGGWASFDDHQGTIAASASLRPALLGLRHRSLGAPPPWGLHMGIFVVDSLTVGAGMLYSDYSGRTLRNSRFASMPDSDHWGSIVWTSFRLSAYVTNRFALSVRPYIYWLPLENKVGFSAASGIFGLASGFAPSSMLDAAYRINLGPLWDLSFSDRFGAIMNQRSILNEPLVLSASFQDVSSHDLAGQYAFGGFSPPTKDVRYRDRFSINDQLFDNNRVFFRNAATARLSGRIGVNTGLHFIYRRFDQWDDSFNHLAGWNTAGAVLLQSRPMIDKFVSYMASSRDDSEYLVQSLSAGVNALIGPRIRGFASGGHMWLTNGNQGGRELGRDSWIGRAGVEHLLGPRVRHGLAAGKMVTDPDFGTRYLADFARYYLAMDLSRNLLLRFYYQRVEGERLDSTEDSDLKSEVYGSLLAMTLSPADSVSILNSYETYERSGGQAGGAFWSHRLSYIHQMRMNMYAQLYYQYQHGQNYSAGDSEFSEHLLYLGMMKRF